MYVLRCVTPLFMRLNLSETMKHSYTLVVYKTWMYWIWYRWSAWSTEQLYVLNIKMHSHASSLKVSNENECIYCCCFCRYWAHSYDESSVILYMIFMRFGCVRVTDSNDFQLACKYLSDTHALIQLMRAQNCIPMQRICLTIEM